MADSKIILLRITEGTRVVAEAELTVYDKTQTLRNFYEALPSVTQMALPALIGMMQMACAENPPAGEVIGLDLKGNHTGLVIGGQLPSENGNGHTPNRDERRHPGF